MATAIQLAEQLLALVKDAHATSDASASYQARNAAQHVCESILRELMGPLEYTSVVAQSCQESAALQFVTELDVSDVVGDVAKSVHDISAATGADPVSLSVALNCVAGRGFFEETEFGSETYKNTELSRLTSAQHPTTLKDTIGLAADDAFRAAAFLTDAAKSKSAGRRRPAHAHAFGYDGTYFEWASIPENLWRGQRVGKAMVQSHSFANKHVPEDYAWNKLPSPIIDVGGGIGSLEMLLLLDAANHNLSFTIFDIPKTAENAKQAVTAALPADVASRVSFVGGSFLDADTSTNNIPQNAPTYIIRHVLFDWVDAEVVRIMRNVRAAMNADGNAKAAGRKLLLCEMLLAQKPTAYDRQISMQLHVLNNGFVRTEAHMIRLLQEAGFAVEGAHHMGAIDTIITSSVA